MIQVGSNAHAVVGVMPSGFRFPERAAAALAPDLDGELPYVRAGDPVSFLVAAAVLAAVTGLATLIPASRATRVEALIALREE